MASQFTSPILIAPGGGSQPLQRSPLSGGKASSDYDKAWLQQLLFRHPGAPPVEEIDRAFAKGIM